MATEGTKINDALPKVNLSGTEEVPVNDGGNDRKITPDGIANYSINKQFNKPTTDVLNNNDKISINGTAVILWSKLKELIQGLVNSFIGLLDTPSSYSGQSGKFVKVKDSEDGLEFNQPTTDEIELPRDPAADHLIHLKELQSHDSSPFISDGGEVTDKGDGTIDITEAEVWIKTANLLDADFKAVVVPAKNIAIPENQNYIVYVDYNAGTPQFAAMASSGGYFYQNWDKLPFATCVNIVSKIIINTFKDSGTNAVYKNVLTQLNYEAIRYLGGLTPSEVGTRNVAITAGAIALSNDYKGIAPLDTSTGGTFTRLYVTNGVWTRTTGQTQVSNTQYNDITTGLVTIDNNKWANKFLYYIIDSPSYWALLEGQQEFNSLSEAQAASVPASRPPELSPFYAGALLVAKLTVQQGLANFASIQNPFTTTFSGGGVGISEHNLLTGLQGGEAGQYFHLNSLFYTAVLNNYLYNAAKTFKITQNQESLTADRTITWQDKDMTVAGLEDIPKVLTSNQIITVPDGATHSDIVTLLAGIPNNLGGKTISIALNAGSTYSGDVDYMGLSRFHNGDIVISTGGTAVITLAGTVPNLEYFYISAGVSVIFNNIDFVASTDTATTQVYTTSPSSKVIFTNCRFDFRLVGTGVKVSATNALNSIFIKCDFTGATNAASTVYAIDVSAINSDYDTKFYSCTGGAFGNYTLDKLINNSFVDNGILTMSGNDSFADELWGAPTVTYNLTSSNDITPRLISRTVSDIAATTANLNIRSLLSGSLYWAVYLDTDPIPSQTDIINGTGAVDFNNDTITQGSLKTDSISGLTAATEYTVYYFSSDLTDNYSITYSTDFITTA